MMRKQKGYIVPHTHWDREWRYPIWQNRLLLIRFFDELFKILDTDDQYKCFVLDGQSIIIEDYLEVRPQDEEKIKKYVSEARIKIGPWYTLPDLFPIDGECLIRNLMKGLRCSDSLGGHLDIGYNSFGWGQTAQFPQIYAGFGIDFIIAAKNVSKNRAPISEFLWTSPDGTQILTTRLGQHARANFFMNAYILIMFDKTYTSDEYDYTYGQSGMLYHEADDDNAYKDYFNLNSKPKVNDKRIKSAVECAWEATEETSVKDIRLLMNGSDFSTPQPYLSEIIEKANEIFHDKEFVHATIEQYAKELKEKIDLDNIPVVYGELRDGPASSCSSNALATRPKIKMLNKVVQNSLLMQSEPFSVMAKKLGGRYQKEMLDLAIKYMLKSHAHDSINGVTQDKTVDDTMYNLNQALELAQVVANDACGFIISQIDTSDFESDDIILTVLNSLPYERKRVVKVSLDIPQAKNVWDFDMVDTDGNIVETQLISREEKTVPVHDLESRPFPFYADRYTFHMNVLVPACGYNVYKLVPKSTYNRKAVFWKPMRTTNGENIATDTNILENQFVKVEVNPNGTINIFDKETNKAYANLNYIEDTGDNGDYWVYYPPYDNKTFTSKGANAEIFLKDNGELSATVGAKYVVDGMGVAVYYTLTKYSKNVSVKLVVDNNKFNHRASVCFDTCVITDFASAGGHFIIDKRPIIPEITSGEYYNEMQYAPMQGFVGLGEFNILSNCFMEYKPNLNGKLEVSLFRAVKNVICTEFRSAGVFPQQNGGQSQGELTFEYAIYLSENNVCKNNQDFSTPLKLVQTSRNKGNLPTTNSLISIVGDVVMSTIKQAEDSNLDIIRLFNPTDKETSIEINGFKNISITNLNEKNQYLANKKINVGSYKIITLEVQ